MKIILIIAALLIAGAILLAPIALHLYKMNECMEVKIKSYERYENKSEEFARERCLSLINSGK